MRLTPRQMLAGYARGIFPMADSADDPALFWVEPEARGLLPIGGIHLSRSMRRSLRGGGWSATLNARFDEVVERCAYRAETWINAPLRDLYAQLHAAGHAHSVEVWQDGCLAGGAFGVSLGGAFFGESMFSARTDGSKAALAWLSVQLGRCGFRVLDTQFPTAHLASLGGFTVSRRSYRALLADALPVPASLTGPLPDALGVLQLTTQMS